MRKYFHATTSSAYIYSYQQSETVDILVSNKGEAKEGQWYWLFMYYTFHTRKIKKGWSKGKAAKAFTGNIIQLVKEVCIVLQRISTEISMLTEYN